MLEEEKIEKPTREWKRSYTIFLVIFLLGAIGAKVWQYRSPKSIIILKDAPLNVLVADTPLLRFRGLGGRASLGKYDGMLFLFPESGRHGIVMRDMEFSIDVVWFFNGEVVDIAQNLALQPGVPEDHLRGYFPRIDADTVLELPAGWAKVHDVKIGDTLLTNPSQ